MGDETLIHLEKTGPIKLLESRRQALVGWLKDGQDAIAAAEAEIKKHKTDAIEMLAEVEEIEAALNALNEASERAVGAPGEPHDNRD